MNMIFSIAHTLRMSMPRLLMRQKTQMTPSMKLKTSVTSYSRFPTMSLTSTAKRSSCPNLFLSNAASTTKLISRSIPFASNTESISQLCQSRRTNILLDLRESDVNSSRACLCAPSVKASLSYLRTS